MKKKANRIYWGMVTGIALVASAFSSCAEERDPIDRVQPYALKKSFFIGEDFNDRRDNPEFYTRTMVTDTDYNPESSYLFPSHWANRITRIKWQITEDMLIGRAAYERIAATDGKGKPELDKNGNAVGFATEDGVVMAAYPIESHFDIVHDYNPTTGEELNILQENTQDRPWYEREYIRVDFAENLSENHYLDQNPLALAKIQDGMDFEPLRYDIEDPNHEDAPFFDFENGYFDVTTKVYVTPKTVRVPYYGPDVDVPACWFENDISSGSWPEGSCDPTEVTIRNSYLRVEPSDFEPLDWTGDKFSTFGGFFLQRFGYARNYGLTDAQWFRFLQRYHIWERSHYYSTDPDRMDGWIPCNTEHSTPFGMDPNRDEDGNRTADECELVTERLGIAGSQCDIFNQRCTLPYRARVPKPLVWHYSTGSDPRYFSSSKRAVHDWDVALRSAVQTAKYAECTATGMNQCEVDNTTGMPDEACASEIQANCQQEYAIWYGQQSDNLDAVELAWEVDLCRDRKAYKKHRDDCSRVADIVGAARGYTDGVIATAKMPEMIVLCHSPVQADDPEPCGEDRLPLGADGRVLTGEDCVAERNLPEEEQDDALIAVCAKGRWARRGDLRYHLINVFPELSGINYWGLMSSGADPLTGEIIQTNCNVWAASHDFYTQLIVDKVRLAAGELSPEELVEAENVADWGKTARAGATRGGLGRLTRNQVKGMVAEFITGKPDPSFFDRRPVAQQTEGRSTGHNHEHFSRQLKAAAASIAASVHAPSEMTAAYQTRYNALQGTEVEAALMTEPVLQLSGVSGRELSDEVYDRSSPLRGGNLSLRAKYEQFRNAGLAERGACLLEAADAPIFYGGLKEVLEEKFGAFNQVVEGRDAAETDALTKIAQQERAERIREYLAQRLHYGIMVHEIGHTIAHRHNFLGSADAFAYYPQYWQLRTKNGTVTGFCNGVDETGEDCIGPRYHDPLTKNEHENLIHMFMKTSAMDYPGDYSQDLTGTGVYDFAATRAFYGGAVAVHKHPSYRMYNKDGRVNPRARGIVDHIAWGMGGFVGPYYTYPGSDVPVSNVSHIHYSELQKTYELIDPDSCEPVDPEAFKPADYDEAASGTWHPVLDGLIVSVDGGQTYTRCRDQEVDYVQWKTLRKPRTDNVEAPNWYDKWSAYDDQYRTVVPYLFATETWVDIGNSAVWRHDNGADPYEIFDFFITTQATDHIFDTYRRKRANFSLRSVSERILYRYNLKLAMGAKGLGWIKNTLSEGVVEVGQAGYRIEDMWRTIADPDRGWLPNTNIVASAMVFDHFASLLAQPEAGDHYLTQLPQAPVSSDDRYPILVSSRVPPGAWVLPGATVATIPAGAFGDAFGNVSLGGALLENDFDFEQGDFYWLYPMNAGSYYTKMNAAMLLAESADRFIGASRFDYLDGRYRAYSLVDLFPEGYRRLLGNMLTGDQYLKAPRIASDQDGRPLVDESGHPRYGIGYTSWWGEKPVTCFPAANTRVCRDYHGIWNDEGWDATAPEHAVPIDPQVGWEQQKFLVVDTWIHLPVNEKSKWRQMLEMHLWNSTLEPDFENRIEFHNPYGDSYLARTFGREEIFGRTVQKGVAARVLEWANFLLNAAMETTPIDIDGDEVVDWYEPIMNDEGEPIIKPDLDPSCDNETDPCKCEDNRACMRMQEYVMVPAYMSEVFRTLKPNTGVRGISDLD